MGKELQILRDHIKKNGLKETPQREEVLSFLLKSKGHQTPEEIFGALRKQDPKIGRATVFRTLKLLEECGLAGKVVFADGQTKYESSFQRAHHDHMICIQCQEVIEFESPVVEALQDRLAGDKGFTILWHRHELFGRCAQCGKKA